MTSQVTPKGATEAVRSVTGHKDDWPWRRPCTLFPHSLVFGCILAFEFLVTVTSYHRSHTESCVWFHLLCVRSPSRRRPRLIVLSSHPTIASPILSFPPFPPFNTSFPSLSRALDGVTPLSRSDAPASFERRFARNRCARFLLCAHLVLRGVPRKPSYEIDGSSLYR